MTRAHEATALAADVLTAFAERAAVGAQSGRSMRASGIAVVRHSVEMLPEDFSGDDIDRMAVEARAFFDMFRNREWRRPLSSTERWHRWAAEHRGRLRAKWCDEHAAKRNATAAKVRAAGERACACGCGRSFALVALGLKRVFYEKACKQRAAHARKKNRQAVGGQDRVVGKLI